MTIKMIAAVSTNGVIGQAGKIPWHYPEDSKFFRAMTKKHILIMGRKTFEEAGKLKDRDTIVVCNSRNCFDENGLKPVFDGAVSIISNFDEAMEAALIQAEKTNQDIWLCGGAGIYQAGMEYASKIYLTLIPEAVYGPDLTRFPWIDPTKFKIESVTPLDWDTKLGLAIYKSTTSDKFDK